MLAEPKSDPPSVGSTDRRQTTGGVAFSRGELQPTDQPGLRLCAYRLPKNRTQQREDQRASCTRVHDLEAQRFAALNRSVRDGWQWLGPYATAVAVAAGTLLAGATGTYTGSGLPVPANNAPSNYHTTIQFTSVVCPS